MIPVTLIPPPSDFDTLVRNPGNKWLADNPNATPSDFPDRWNKPSIRKELRRAFTHRCAYLGHWIPSGQVDHFVPKDQDRTQTYAWENYRWAEPRVNNKKRTAAFLDPFTLEVGWIGIDPKTLKYFITASLPAHLHAVAQATLNVLNDPELVDAREEWLAACDPKQTGKYLFPIAHFPLLAETLQASGLFAVPTP